MEDITTVLSQRITKREIQSIVMWCMEKDDNIETLYNLTKAKDDRLSVNALWCLTHLPKESFISPKSKQYKIIDSLLKESNVSKKKTMLQILREIDY